MKRIYLPFDSGIAPLESSVGLRFRSFIRMSDATHLPAASEAVELLEPLAVLGAVSDPVRYALLREVAGSGVPLTVNELADRVGHNPENISKHLLVLRKARVLRVVSPPGADGRCLHHEIPSFFRRNDAAGAAIVDFGAVMLRFGGERKVES
jgi:hypothetical protein